MGQVFISHSSRDRDFMVGRLKPALEDCGFDAWCSSTDLKIAAKWEQQIRAALARADWFVVVLSPDAQRSEWVQAETHLAVEHLMGREIPIMARSCRPVDLHLRLGTLQFVDFRADFELAVHDLVPMIQSAEQDHATGCLALTVADGSQRTTLVAYRRGTHHSWFESSALMRPSMKNACMCIIRRRLVVLRRRIYVWTMIVCPDAMHVSMR